MIIYKRWNSSKRTYSETTVVVFCVFFHRVGEGEFKKKTWDQPPHLIIVGKKGYRLKVAKLSCCNDNYIVKDSDVRINAEQHTGYIAKT